jgi:Skp family chaperone for outer membrane proteins
MTVLAGVAVIGVLGYVSSRLWAQAPGSQARVSVAIINLPQTLNMYDKFKAYQTEFKSKMDQAMAEDNKIKTKMAEFEIIVRGGDTTKKYTDKDKENAEAWITKLKRDREDLAGKIKKDFGNRSAEQFVAMYKEVEDQVKLYAKSNGFQVVLHYSDHINEAEKYTPDALQRKLANGACMPLYTQDGVDITNAVANILNQAYRSRSQQPIVPTAGVVPAKK